MQDSRERRVLPEVKDHYGAGEAIVPVSCGYCDNTGLKRVTYINHWQTAGTQIIFKETQIEEGPVSWQRSHLGCKGNDLIP